MGVEVSPSGQQLIKPAFSQEYTNYAIPRHSTAKAWVVRHNTSKCGPFARRRSGSIAASAGEAPDGGHDGGGDGGNDGGEEAADRRRRRRCLLVYLRDIAGERSDNRRVL